MQASYFSQVGHGGAGAGCHGDRWSGRRGKRKFGRVFLLGGVDGSQWWSHSHLLNTDIYSVRETLKDSKHHRHAIYGDLPITKQYTEAFSVLIFALLQCFFPIISDYTQVP